MNEVRMTPVPTGWQEVVSASLDVTPEPTHRTAFRDYFGTVVETFEVASPHDALEVLQSAEVEVRVSPEPPGPAPDENVTADGVEYLFASPMVVANAPAAELGAKLRAGDAESTVRSVLDWIREEMTYETGQTEVGTPVAELLSTRRGVCQDFAHVACALLRVCDVPARYVSGYFAPRELEIGETVQAQSHAWVEALVPGWGWWPVDPTNHLTSSDRHVKVGHGRDYADIVPFQGVHVGAADQTLEVTVTIQRLA
jgi:transglutaminase-like putative cysteine protease